MNILMPITAAGVIAGFFISALLLWLIARFLRAEKATYLRACAVVFVTSVLGALNLLVALVLETQLNAVASGYVSLAILGIGILVLFGMWLLIQQVLGATFGRSILIWLLHVAAVAPLTVVIVIALKAFIMQAYVMPTNSMAPTIIGYHHEKTCPHCQGNVIMPAPEPNFAHFWPEGQEMEGICVSCRKTSKHVAAKAAPLTPDRILVTKLAAPERWDLLVFRYPEEPANKWVMRLVALPGEKIYIHDKAVWINDVRQVLPREISGLEYVEDMEWAQMKATKANPFLLGAEEYFVLGDFSRNSNDSRRWGAVPAANVEGVACARYWPMNRWAILR